MTALCSAGLMEMSRDVQMCGHVIPLGMPWLVFPREEQQLTGVLFFQVLSRHEN